MYIHIRMYIDINIFIATAPFPMGQQCQYLAHGTWPCQRKKKKNNKRKKQTKKNKNNILVKIFIFFFPKIGI